MLTISASASLVALQVHAGGQIPAASSYSLVVSPSSTFSLPPSPVLGTSPKVIDSDCSLLPTSRDELEDIKVLVTAAYHEPERPPLDSSNKALEVTCTNASVANEQMKAVKTKTTIGVLATLISYVSLNSIYRNLNPRAFIWQDEDREEAVWVSTSKSWLDRKACRWLGVCGATHMHLVGSYFGKRVTDSSTAEREGRENPWDWQNAWTEGADRPEDWTADEEILRNIPDYVMEYAPLVHLYSGEQFWPCDIAEHLYHVTPTLNYTPLREEWADLTLQNLDKLNELERGRWVFLTSDDNVEERPDWLEGERNIPIEPSVPEAGWPLDEDLTHTPGRTYTEGLKDSLHHLKEWYRATVDEALDQVQEAVEPSLHDHTTTGVKSEDFHREIKRQWSTDPPRQGVRGGRSHAPAVLVTVNKGHGIVDAFWFFFYSFNLGNVVFNVRFGNHVGDWEHTAIRFHHGEPKAVFFSEHNFGSAYSYDAVEKIGKRPIIYSAYGTHAMYATSGGHPYILPWGVLHDQTDEGPLWDPALNSHSYTYDFKNGTLRSSNLTPKAPTNWFHYAGHWGDKFYPLGDKRQYRFAGQYHYVNGPLGPKFKNLGRKKICGGPDSAPCVIKNWLSLASPKLRQSNNIAQAEGEEMTAEDEERFFGKPDTK